MSNQNTHVSNGVFEELEAEIGANNTWAASLASRMRAFIILAELHAKDRQAGQSLLSVGAELLSIVMHELESLGVVTIPAHQLAEAAARISRDGLDEIRAEEAGHVKH